jgi:hypothetical protein
MPTDAREVVTAVEDPKPDLIDDLRRDTVANLKIHRVHYS